MAVWTSAFLWASGDLLAGAPASAPSSSGAEKRGEHGDEQACPVCRYAEQVGMRMMALYPIARHRCPPPTYPMLAAMPRGRVRLSELDAVTAELGLDYPDLEIASPGIEFRLAGDALGRLALPAETIVERLRIERGLRNELRGLRGRIEWGGFLEDEPQSMAAIWIEERTPRERRLLERIAQHDREAPAWIRRIVRAKALLDAEYDYGALKTAETVFAEQLDEPHAAALIYAAYANMGICERFGPAIVFGSEVIDRLREERKEPTKRCHLDVTHSGRYLRPGSKVRRAGCGG